MNIEENYKHCFLSLDCIVVLLLVIVAIQIAT